MRRIIGAWLAGCAVLFLGGQGVAQVAKVSTPRKFELHAESPKFWELFAQDATLGKVAAGLGFTEGPVWDPKGFLYVSDEDNNKLLRVYPDGRIQTMLEIGDPDGSTLDAQGHLITTASVLRAIIQVDPDGKYKVLAGTYEGKKFNSPNDVILGPDGALYFTDPTLDLVKGEKQETPFQGVYRLGKDGAVKLLTKDLVQPNGLAFSPDGKRLYIDDTKQQEIRVYDAGRNGDLTNGRVFGKEPGPNGVPDGMRVDVKGNVYVTGPGGIWVWDPGGNHLGTIMMPESTANLNWGDADYQTLYITASTSVYRLRTKARGFVPWVKAPAAK
jgi:gluconolactonase